MADVRICDGCQLVWDRFNVHRCLGCGQTCCPSCSDDDDEDRHRVCPEKKVSERQTNE